VAEQRAGEDGPPPDLLMGLFGTTAFYDHVTSTQLVSLEKVVRLTRLLRSMRVSVGLAAGCGVVVVVVEGGGQSGNGGGGRHQHTVGVT
jgi:hypothetical protein